MSASDADRTHRLRQPGECAHAAVTHRLRRTQAHDHSLNANRVAVVVICDAASDAN
jgi:hypothetical protein